MANQKKKILVVENWLREKTKKERSYLCNSVAIYAPLKCVKIAANFVSG